MAQKITLQADTATELMTSGPTAIDDTMSLEQAAKALLRYSAVPVIDATRHVVGVLSRTDLVRAFKDTRAPAELLIPVDEERPSGIEYRTPRRVADAMNRDFIAVPLEATASEVIAKMVDHNVGRVFVVDDERRLVGVISSTDILWSLRV